MKLIKIDNHKKSGHRFWPISDIYGALLVPYTRAYSFILEMYPFFILVNSFLPLARLFLEAQLFFTGATFLCSRDFFLLARLFLLAWIFLLAWHFFAGAPFFAGATCFCWPNLFLWLNFLVFVMNSSNFIVWYTNVTEHCKDCMILNNAWL